MVTNFKALCGLKIVFFYISRHRLFLLYCNKSFTFSVNLFTFHHKPLLSTSLRQKKCGKIVSVFATSCFASKVLLKCHRKCDSFIQSSEKVFVFDRENSYSPSLKANTPRFKAYIISPVLGGFFAH